MPDDKSVSQLISASLRRRLTPNETDELDRSLATNEEAKKFAALSKLIQESVSPATFRPNESAETSGEKGNGLSTDAKDRLRESVAAAVREKQQLAKSGLISATHKTPVSRPEPASDDFREHVSRFKLIRRLGQGGLGNVWLALDEKLNRTVAIKELRPEALESPDAWARFHREAEITGHLEHPSVVPLYQYGVDETKGEPFYAMRFVGKRTLADAIVEYHDRVEAGKAGTLELHRLLSVCLDVCQAIAYAHSRGVIHRDLKPENVALDSFGQVIVLDWGLAKVLEDCELKMRISSESLSESRLTQTMHGDVVGTPLYMSPEQALGESEKIDVRTDIYGIGAILFAILTGQAPHENSVINADKSIDEVIKRIAAAEAPSPSEHSKSVPSELDAICRTAMARKQHLRYDTVRDLADAVERWMAGQSEKQAAYEDLRMQGRELRADLRSSVLNLERNVRFAATLPPIEQLMRVDVEDEVGVWRERLATIFTGLLRANPHYQSLVYYKVDEDEFTEIVRVERHSRENANIRAVPRSRLRTGKVSDYMQQVIDRKPDEVLTSLVADPLCENRIDCTMGLLSGVPVFDSQTEDVFGTVTLNCDLDYLLRQQLRRRMSAGEVVVSCDAYQTIMRAESGQIRDEDAGQPLLEVSPHFSDAIEVLKESAEYIDTTNSDVYGARVWFVPDQHGVMYLLKR